MMGSGSRGEGSGGKENRKKKTVMDEEKSHRLGPSIEEFGLKIKLRLC